jgi:hypothetical protein
MLSEKRPGASIVLVACIALFPLCFAACQVAVPLALTSSSMGVAYYYMNVSEKTCVYDLDTMNKASVLTLKRMGFTLGEQSKDEDGDRKIKAQAEELDVTVKLKKVTPRCTKIKVTACKDLVIRDKATASEIILQTEKTAALMQLGRHRGL